MIKKLLERNRLNKRLHWTTIASEKTLLAVIGILTVLASIEYVWGMFQASQSLLPICFSFLFLQRLLG